MESFVFFLTAAKIRARLWANNASFLSIEALQTNNIEATRKMLLIAWTPQLRLAMKLAYISYKVSSGTDKL